MKLIMENWKRFTEAIDYSDHLQSGNSFYLIDDRGKKGFVVALFKWGEQHEFALEYDERGRMTKSVKKPIFRCLGYFVVTTPIKKDSGCYHSTETIFKPAHVRTHLDGKGPILYDLVLEYCKIKNYWFMPDIHQKISPSAKKLWQFYFTKRKNELEILQFDRKKNPFITPDDPKDDCWSNVLSPGDAEKDQGWLDSPFTKLYRRKDDKLIKFYEKHKVIRITKNRFPDLNTSTLDSKIFVWENNDLIPFLIYKKKLGKNS